MKLKHSESDIKKSILQWLNAQPCTFAFPVYTTGIPNGKGRFRKNPQAGTADILFCKDSKFAALEVKTPTGKVSDLQRSFLQCVSINGNGYAAIVRSLDDAQECWREI